MVTFKHKGDFSNVISYFTKLKKAIKPSDLEKYGQEGVQALMSATPVDTGKTAASWYYTIEIKNDSATINFNNSNIQNGWAPVAILIQLGHGTGTGGWVQGRDYINPAIRPIFDKIADNAWREVTKL